MKAARSRAELNDLLGSRRVDHVVVLGANGAMGYGSGALFTSTAARVTFLARARDKAQQGLDAAIKSVRSSTVADRADTGDYDRDFDAAVSKADIIFEALTEDFELKRQMFERVDKVRRPDSIVATVTSGLSINALAEGRSESFRKHFLGLHFFNPPNVIVGTELVAGKDTDPRPRRVRRGVRAEDARARDDPHRGHARLRRQPRRLQGAQRGGAARRRARPRARRPPGRPLHRARADAARHGGPRGLGHPPRDRGQHSQARARRGARDPAAAGVHGSRARARRARQQERPRLLQGRGQGHARARSEDRRRTGPSPRSSCRISGSSTRSRGCTATDATARR